MCSFHKQMGQKGNRFREKSPPALHKSGDSYLLLPLHFFNPLFLFSYGLIPVDCE